MGFPGSSAGKESTCNAGDATDIGLILGLERSPGKGNGYPIQYSCLENPINRGTWRAADHRVAKSQTRLSAAQHNLVLWQHLEFFVWETHHSYLPSPSTTVLT